jgi:hypothetical protein
MQLAQYLICVATRHEKAKSEHEEELKVLRLRGKKSTWRNLPLTYKDEAALFMEVSSSVRGKPSCLKMLALPALGVLAYIVKAKMAIDPYIQGYEIIDKLVCDPERTIVYLEGLAELREKGWIRLFEQPGMAFTDQPPFCWLQAWITKALLLHMQVQLRK